jgi:hypothetical protein
MDIFPHVYVTFFLQRLSGHLIVAQLAYSWGTPWGHSPNSHVTHMHGSLSLTLYPYGHTHLTGVKQREAASATGRSGPFLVIVTHSTTAKAMSSLSDQGGWRAETTSGARKVAAALLLRPLLDLPPWCNMRVR